MCHSILEPLIDDNQHDKNVEALKDWYKCDAVDYDLCILPLNRVAYIVSLLWHGVKTEDGVTTMLEKTVTISDEEFNGIFRSYMEKYQC